MEWIDRVLSIVNTNFDVPGWVVLASLVIGAVFVFLLFVRSEPNENPLTILVLIGILLGGLAVGSAMLKQLIIAAAISEARALEARASGLDGAAAQSPALGCLVADASLAGVCEAVLFERPDTVAAGRALMRARMALVEDAFEFVRRRKAEYLTERIIAWRRPLEADPYGLVASALMDLSGCTATYCPQAAIFGDPTRILANMTEGRYAALVNKYTPIWERNARNRGTVSSAQPVRTGPFGFAVPEQGTPAAHPNGPSGERAPAAQPPVEEAETPPPPAPLPPARPPRTPAVQAPPAANPAPRPAASRPRPPAAPDVEPAAEGTAPAEVQ